MHLALFGLTVFLGCRSISVTYSSIFWADLLKHNVCIINSSLLKCTVWWILTDLYILGTTITTMIEIISITSKSLSLPLLLPQAVTHLFSVSVDKFAFSRIS